MTFYPFQQVVLQWIFVFEQFPWAAAVRTMHNGERCVDVIVQS